MGPDKDTHGTLGPEQWGGRGWPTPTPKGRSAHAMTRTQDSPTHKSSDKQREREGERKRERERERFGEHLLHPTSSRPVWSFHHILESGCAAMECHGDRLPWRYLNTECERHDVGYDEAREGASRDWRQPADCGMPGYGVSFQKNAGYDEDGDTDDVFPRQAAESNALLFSLSQSRRLVTWSSRCV